jgi:hypothetical protein
MAKKKAAKAPKKAAKASKGAKQASKRAAKSSRKAAKAPKKAAKAPKKKPTRPGARAAKKGPKAKATSRRQPVRKPAAKAPARAAKKSPAVQQARKQAEARTAAAVGRKPNLDRERRTVQEDVHGVPSSLNLDRTASAARSGRQEFEQKLREHTSTGPAMTGGDIDADWEDAETVGDEAPGGDNPTPDQDIVDEIGKAIGIEYDDDEELQGGDELAERDRHRWELDPASKDDFEDE